MDLYQELALHTGRDQDLVRARCQAAAIELAWQWPQYKDRPLEFYRATDLYQFDLTEWQARLHQTGWHRWFSQLLEHLKPKRILDFGGGIGEYTIDAWTAGVRDIDFVEVAGSQTLKYATHRFSKREMLQGVKIQSEGFKLFREYDLIVAMDVLEHIEDPEPIIRNFSSLSPLLISDPDQQPYNAFFPQHVSHPDLKPYYDNAGGNLWKRK